MSDPINQNDVQQKYKKYDHREHVLHCPGMYIGSVQKDIYQTWIHADGNEECRFVKKAIEIVPGLYKIFDEILVNAIDQITRLKGIETTVHHVKNIKVTIDRSTGEFSVYNDGDGIEVELHPIHDVYIPELIFGNMLTSSNYEEGQERIIGGQNGIGAKACNIFSKRFRLETIDHKQKKLYIQEFSNNMIDKSTPIIKQCVKKPYTMIKFTPDYERFGLSNGLTDDLYAFFVKRCYDVCALTDSDVTLWLNSKKIPIKTFERYVDMYLGDKAVQFRAYEKLNDRWEIVVGPSLEQGFEQVSFVNGIWTVNGGKHVDYIVNQICTKLGDLITKRCKGTIVKSQHIKNNLMVFIKSTISNPTFDSQSKEFLTTPSTKFGGSKAEISDKFIEKLYKSPLLERILNLSNVTAANNLKKTDGKKTARVIMEKLDDANWAGTKNSKDCTLILTEGLSAATMAIAGLSVVGRDTYGVFPLRGKILNVKDALAKRIQDNNEITSLKKILGLEHGKIYKDVSELRYGRIMLMTDSDHDGSHIKGLFFNVFQSLWPSLYQLPGFLTAMLTPIIKVTHPQFGMVQFYNMSDYEKWTNTLGVSNSNSWKVKYYKGLGTSTELEAKEYFQTMKQVTYEYDGKSSDEAIELAFNKKRADDRKAWLMNYNKDTSIDNNESLVTYTDFVHKELIHFSNRDLERSINHLCDGLKESTRKILFGCFKSKLWKDEIKVAQLAGNISLVSAYHHGEASLQQAIVGMAQQIVGTNNINLLVPNGQFGTRIHGGADAGAPRYIYTLLSKLTRKLFRDEDMPVLKTLEDDGIKIEPEWYIPVVPLILINGGIGIGTGFSTNIPNHNPEQVIEICYNIINKLELLPEINDYTSYNNNIDAILDTIEFPDLTPWYHGFKGTISPQKQGTYISKGIYEWTDDSIVTITELPVGCWTSDYKDMLNSMLSSQNNKYLKDYESHYSDKEVKFVLKLNAGVRPELEPIFDTEFKLSSTKNLSHNNMHLYSSHGAIKKYDTVGDIVKEWSKVRLYKYFERKDFQVKALQEELKYVTAKAQFIQDILNSRIIVNNKSLQDLIGQLSAANYPKEAENDEGGFGYLTRMPVHHLTSDKIVVLNDQVETMKSKLQDLLHKSILSIWKEELDELLVAWTEHKRETDLSATNIPMVSGSSSKKTKKPRQPRKLKDQST